MNGLWGGGGAGGGGGEEEGFARPRSLSVEMMGAGRMSRSGSTTSMEESDDMVMSEDQVLMRRRRKPTEALHLPNFDITDKISRRMSITEHPAPVGNQTFFNFFLLLSFLTFLSFFLSAPANSEPHLPVARGV